MAMPNDLILIRHGESEANILNKSLRAGATDVIPNGYHERHDSYMRLSPEGTKQAQAAGEWLKNNNLASFERYYVSPHIRARETAGRLGINGEWRVEDRWRERNWGEYANLSNEERSKVFGISQKLREQHSWYWCPPGGESLATEVRLRFESMLGTLHRETASKRVIAVTHGDLIEAARFVLERMTPEEWSSQIELGIHPVKNCQILHYSRVNPHNGSQEKWLCWRRIICPWDESLSWQNGEWVELQPSIWSDEQLLESVKDYDRLLKETAKD